MAEIEAKLQKMGLVLPKELITPAGLTLPFKPVVLLGNRAYISGHAPGAELRDFSKWFRHPGL